MVIFNGHVLAYQRPPPLPIPVFQNGNDYLYDVVEVFHAVSGGDWAQRPALFDTLWRVQNLEVTYGQWSCLLDTD